MQMMMRSALFGALALALAACESAPSYDPSLSGGGGAGGATTSGAYGTGGRSDVRTAPLGREEAQRQFAMEVGDRVFFDYDSFTLKPEGRATLDKQVAWLKRNTQWRVVIEGHSDERGTREYNLALADRRATTVKSYLVNQGIPADRISTISYGKERPVAIGSNEAAWAQNRRGVTVLAN
jgi:peptidoglycan-associated lipoprotein